MGIVTKIAKDAKLLHRRVYCLECGSEKDVANGLRDGWPKCCGYTMTIDHPSTRKRQ